jgi:hypothetical protein
MEFQILDENFELVDVFDDFDSAIWANRSKKTGDCELYCIANQRNRDMLKPDYYVTRLDDGMTCIIEAVTDVSDVEEGNYLTVKGRDLKSILARRIVWNQTQLSGTVENCIRQLLMENVVNPTDSSRRIDNFVLSEAHGFGDMMEKQVTGDNLLTVIEEICAAYDYGFSVELVEGQFIFDLTIGTDRSWGQDELNYVVFSANFDNLITSDYGTDKTELRNVALVAGEGEGVERKTNTVHVGSVPSGLSRRELYVDARDLSTNNGEISNDVYMNQLRQRGLEGLAAAVELVLFESEIQPVGQFEYKRDYALHDIVQIQSNGGVEAKVRIVEIIETQDEGGYSLRPVFEVMEVL